MNSSQTAELLDTFNGDASWDIPKTLRKPTADASPVLIGLLLETFMNDTETRLQDVKAAVSNDDPSRLRMEVRSVKGSACHVGAAVMAAICQKIEAASYDEPTAHLRGHVAALEDNFSAVSAAMREYCRSASARC
jgi:HPt (histidine-containing phosphotransfer) domain-containing protein